MDLDVGHGSCHGSAGITTRPLTACIGPANLFSSASLALPWAVVYGAWAEGAVDLLATLRAHGTKLLIDTLGWCYRFNATFEVAKLRNAAWAPWPQPAHVAADITVLPPCTLLPVGAAG